MEWIHNIYLPIVTTKNIQCIIPGNKSMFASSKEVKQSILHVEIHEKVIESRGSIDFFYKCLLMG